MSTYGLTHLVRGVSRASRRPSHPAVVLPGGGTRDGEARRTLELAGRHGSKNQFSGEIGVPLQVQLLGLHQR